MSRARRLAGAAAGTTLALVLAAVMAACGGSQGSSSGGPGGSGDRVPRAGGTLQLLLPTGLLGSLDPAESYSQSSENLSPLILSPLTAYVPGVNPPRIVGDLATNSGVPSDGARVWTYHLKTGVEYDNGSAVTSYDVKYDVERSFDPSLAGGPPYLAMWLEDAAEYKGPFSGKSLASVQTPNASTIVFHLNQPVGDFDYLTTYPEFAGVPVSDTDAGADYQYHMATSGPYEIRSYAVNKSLVLVRDPHWKTANNPYFKDYPARIVATLGLSPSVLDQDVIASQGVYADAVSLDEPIQPADLSRVLSNRSVRDRTQIQPTGAALTYIGLDVKTKPFENQLVRQAVEWAVDKTTAQTALGGYYGAGPVADQILGPGVPGYRPFDLYSGPNGDPATARALLTRAGYPHGFSTTLGVDGEPEDVAAAETIENSLARAGITVHIDQYSASVYYTSIVGNPSTEPPMALSEWGADWNNASTIIPPLFDGSALSPSGPNNDISNFDVPALDAQMVQADGVIALAAASPYWATLDREIMAEAPIVPLVFGSRVYTVGTNIVNGQVDSAYGTPDPMVMAVESSK